MTSPATATGRTRKKSAGGRAREDVDAKALRLLAAGRVTITQVYPRWIQASVDGDTGRYLVQYRKGRWSCTCASFTRCSHRTAVELVTVPLGPATVQADA
jgi:hypothetical protein